MSDEIRDLDEMLGFLSEEERRDPEEHPSPETLTAYQANELSPAEDEKIQSHLAVCKHCAELLLDLDEFLKPPVAVAEPIADFEAAADWRRLREALKPPVEEKSLARPVRRPFLASVGGGYSVAAALLVISAGLGIWNSHLEEKLKEPQSLHTVKTLSAQGSSRGPEGSRADRSVLLPAQIDLNLQTDHPAPRYRIDIVRPGRSKPEWSLDTIPESGALSLYLPKKSLSPGTYVLRVAPFRGGQPASEIWNYQLIVEPSAD
ncbi:MAG TPA: zf-HC2 domain-containing protein [Thermoanaerobaculia bacterium]